MKRLILTSSAMLVMALLAKKAAGGQCPSCKPKAMELTYLGSPSADDPSKLEKLENWKTLQATSLDFDQTAARTEVHLSVKE